MKFTGMTKYVLLCLWGINMAIRYEGKFNLNNVFKPDDKYKAYMLSITMARQDLYRSNKFYLSMEAQEGQEYNMLYFVKLSIAHLYEAKQLLDKSTNIIRQNNNAMGVKINKLRKDYKSLFKVINEIRNCVFHYHKDSDLEKYILKTLKNLEDKHIDWDTGFVIGEKNKENNYYFADEFSGRKCFSISK